MMPLGHKPRPASLWHSATKSFFAVTESWLLRDSDEGPEPSNQKSACSKNRQPPPHVHRAHFLGVWPVLSHGACVQKDLSLVACFAAAIMKFLKRFEQSHIFLLHRAPEIMS